MRDDKSLTVIIFVGSIDIDWYKPCKICKWSLWISHWKRKESFRTIWPRQTTRVLPRV